MKNYPMAVRFFGGNRDCTYGNPGKNGRMNKAIEIFVFADRSARDAWVERGNCDAKGPRESVTRADLARMQRGYTPEQRIEEVEWAIQRSGK